ncbi:two-component system activity regulator YycH [Neobacillus niacini]|uniref:YycH family regulatory protein n=1 Tax=Neobacillus niacini TaxID=86668 RepID=UPI0028584F69|nr:two-component system activity regulator YycH [Neobacillus niacini]MDR7000036.1 regulatory protein YycH of two-component signal transduction system YycFG [Neobacillus niacini]
MRYENIKSVILTILVIVSIVLTWNLWTYQPDYETMKNGNTVAEVSLSEKQEVQKILRPDQILYHISSHHYGTSNTDELEKIMKQLSQWTFLDVENYTEKAGNLNNLVHGNGKAEIIFPGEIPIAMYRSVLNFEERKIPSFNFDRIVMNVENSSKDFGTVYFVSSEHQQVFISHISAALLKGFEKDFYKKAVNLPRYFAYKPTSKRTIFLPEGETEMMEYRYLPKTLDSNEFKEALFTDPSFVQKSMLPHGEEYTNDSSKMNVYYDSNMLVYVNPTVESEYTSNSYDLVKKSIDFVNEHGGWTDPYRYVSKDDYNQAVVFRLYSMDGYPVHNDQGASEIKEVWGKNELMKYIRPNISLDLPLRSETKKMILPSGRKAIKFLEDRKNFNPDLLKKIELGYRMERDSQENKIILLEPAWFYQYDDTWVQITMDQGGFKHGLE